jgi:3-deoxy-7-phosphoheptulonate synthase
MIIVLKPEATELDAKEILSLIEKAGLKPLHMPGTERVVIGAVGDERILGELHLENHPIIEGIKPILAPYTMVSREFHESDSIIDIEGIKIGGDNFAIIAGPCAIESKEQMDKTISAVKKAGAHGFRGGAYKPRTSPYSFQGLGLEGLELLKYCRDTYKLPGVTEVVEVADVKAVQAHASAFQVGARNMQNFRLLKELGKTKMPVILKRGMAAKVDDLLMAAEYILSEGNPNVILCERGIRTFETVTRNTLDLNAIPYIKAKSHLPVIVDPSHGTGVRDFVAPMAKAALACGADGLIIEVHHNPKIALSDGQQSLFIDQFEKLMKELKPIANAVGKKIL